jgi:hypothetical protein
MKLRILAVGVMLAALLSVLIAVLWGTPPLAELAFTEGAVERDRRGAENLWQDAQVGNELELGDGLRTGARSRARLALSHGTVLQVDADTTLRLLASAPGGESVRIERGSAQVEAGEVELTIETSAGPVRVEPKGRVSLRESKQDTWVRVDMGRAELGWSQAGPVLAGQERSTPHAESELAALTPTAGARAAASSARDSADRAPAEGIAALVRGSDVRLQRQGEDAASPLVAGAHRLPLGARVTVAADSSLELEQGQGGSLVTSGRAELVVGDGEHVTTHVLSGKVRASAGRVPVEVDVPGGRIVLLVDQTGIGSATLRVSKQETQVDVARGSVALRGKGRDETLSAGESGQLNAAQAKPAHDSAVEEAPQAASRPSKEPEPTGHALSDLSLPLGVTAQVHDPKPPSAIAFALGDKCGGKPAVLEQASRPGRYSASASGAARLVAWFPAGSTAYRVRCQPDQGGKVVATGRISVQRDAAERQVTRRAPELEVELDGRKYTAMYQTLLPRVRVRPSSPVSGGMVRVRSGATSRDYPLAKGALTLESGQLKEGEHSLTLEGGSARGQAATLIIRFDNAAPTAYLESAQALARNADGTFTLRGGALPGSEVSVDGARVPLDAEGRFETRASLAPGARGFGVAIKHPRAGSHYYVRRGQDGRAP